MFNGWVAGSLAERASRRPGPPSGPNQLSEVKHDGDADRAAVWWNLGQAQAALLGIPAHDQGQHGWFKGDAVGRGSSGRPRSTESVV